MRAYVREAMLLLRADWGTNRMESPANHRPTILVTGGKGLLGARVLPLLVQSLPDAEIISIERNEQQPARGSTQIKVVYGDLRDRELWASLPNTITCVVHLAAVIPWKAEDRYKASVVTDNLLPLANLIEHSQEWPNFRQIIYSSSVSIYAQTDQLLHEDSPLKPANLYGASKLAGEEILSCMEGRGVRTVSLRFSSLYSFGQYNGTVLPIMVNRALQKQPILIFGDGTRTQDFLHCEDAARAVLLCFEKEARGVYNVGTGTPVTMTELAQTVSHVFSAGKAEIVYQPTKVDRAPGMKLDITKARRELNYDPRIQLEHGLRKLKEEMGSLT